MRFFESLNEREILALAISQEEDARIYDDFAAGLKKLSRAGQAIQRLWWANDAGALTNRR